MNKLLVILTLLCSVTLLVAGCSKQVPVVSSDDSNTGNTLSDAGTSAPHESTNPNSGSDDTISTDTGTDVVGETKTPADIHDETLAAVADGTYVENVNYMSPGGQDTVKISITVANDIVTDASISAVSADGKSQNYISKVNAALPNLVIGKKITEIDIPRQISGSSLTSAAFKKELAKVIADNPA